MARTELIERRTPTSKHFRLDDGTCVAECGPHAHHLVNGLYVETDCYLYGGNTEQSDPVSGETFTHETQQHPIKIRLNKFKQPYRVGDVTIHPLDCAQVTGVKSLNRVTYSQPWDGIDVTRIVTPNGLVEELTITSASGQRLVSWAVVGDCTFAPYYTSAFGFPVAVPYTFADGILTFDLRGVPVWAVVR